MNILRKTLALLGGAALLVGISLIPNTTFAQSYGHGIFHHSEHGILGGAGHYSYGDHYANQRRMHQGYQNSAPQYSTPQYSTPQYMSPQYSAPAYGTGYTGTAMPQMQYNGAVSQGVPTGSLYPGMVLPDGSVVVSVGQ